MPKVIIVGGGLAGCGAALAAAKSGARVTLLERTDMLIGVAVRSGETRGNGNFIAQHELRFLGGKELFEALETVKLHDGIKFPDVAKHTFIFHTALAEPLIKRIVKETGVEVLLESRAIDVKRNGSRIMAVKLEDGRLVEGDAFVDCTGSRGGSSVCTKYGKGCVMCLVRCFAFGDRVGIVEKAGGKVFDRHRPDGTPGNLGGGVMVFKDTLSPELKARIEEEGLVKVPLPKNFIDYSRLQTLAGKRNKDYVENIVLTDIGPAAKCSHLGPIELDKLRETPGFENAQVEDPRTSKYNHVGFVSMAIRDNSMKVEECENLFCAGEKACHSSVDAAIITGYLAGHNAARSAFKKELLVLPTSLAIGDFIAYASERFKTEDGRNKNLVMSRGEYWERLQKIGLYTDNVGE
ncbi:FAD-dependent oxidoreductase, partial [Chloroflexota bacterium]